MHRQKLMAQSQYLISQYRDNQKPLIRLRLKLEEPPCYYCKFSVDENKCDATTCDKLTAWLLATRGN